MPFREIILAPDEIYHILNRSIEEATILKGKNDYQRALDLIEFYQYENPPLSFSHYKRLPIVDKGNFLKSLEENHQRLVEILAFCLMPNHFHLLLKQTVEKGISIFMSNFQNGYVRYFNIKYDRTGPLFQSVFKAVRIETDEQLLHVSRYIHLNPVTAYLIEIEGLEDYPWSSFPEYLGHSSGFTTPNEVLFHFKTRNSYKKFVFDQADYQRELAKIKKFSLEN